MQLEGIKPDSSNEVRSSVGVGLARAVARYPDDEKLHEWRIAHHVERGESDAALGAVTDCFIATGTKPERRQVRQRALEKARPVLSRADHDRLDELVDGDANRGVVLAFNRNSVLSTGASGTDRLVLGDSDEPPAPLTNEAPPLAPPLPPSDLFSPSAVG